MKQRSSPALSHDIPLFLALIPLINVINYYLTYPQINLSWRLPVTFLIDTLEGYAAWYCSRLIIQRLDDTFPYSRNPLRRVMVQCILTSLVGVGVIIGLTELVNFLATDKPVPTHFYTHDIFIFLIWILVINGIYVALHYYGEYQQAEQLREEATRIKQGGITVQSGRQTAVIPFNGIAGFYVDGDYVMLQANNGLRYVMSQSLDMLEAELPADYFFRLNRQFILHREQLTGFDRLENGKLAVRLKPLPHFPGEVIMSRTKAPGFKRWFEPITR